MLKGILDKAKDVKDKADTRQPQESATQITSSQLNDEKSKVSDLFERYWSQIENVIMNGLLTVTEEKLHDDKTLETIFEKTHQALPIAIRLVLPKKKFVEFCLRKKEPLLLKLQDYKSKRASGCASN